jgi:hypothetical protein
MCTQLESQNWLLPVAAENVSVAPDRSSLSVAIGSATM